MKHNPAQFVIDLFGGMRPLARHLALDPAAILYWRDKGRIPRWHHDRILAVAKRLRISLSREQLGERYK